MIERKVPFTAGDGLECFLVNIRDAQKEPTKGPVIVVHGAGVRGNLFRPPVETTFVDYLVQNGYDVWLENWRASIDLPPTQWTLDKAAAYDHPRAVETIVAETGSDSVKAVIHCQGSTSFTMAAVAGLVPQVKTIVSNAVSLHTVVPPFSVVKIRFMLPLVGLLTKYLNPQWGIQAPTLAAKMLRLMGEATHHECDNPVCHQISLIYGSGFPALWSHDNLNTETHEWLTHEFADVSVRFFNQMGRCVREGHLVSVDGLAQLPADFVAEPPRTDARFAFIAGEQNLCFLPESQIRTFEYFDRQRPGYHSLHVVPGYGHLDVFMGRNAVRDTFPLMLAELDR
jgi:hypothetical protein